MAEITIIADIPLSPGWAPILHMQRLFAELAGASCLDISGSKSNRLHSIWYAHKRRNRRVNNNIVICITTLGYNARKFVPIISELGGFSKTILWVIDSFWTKAVMSERKLIDRHFDIVCYMQSFDDEFYRKLFGSRAIRLEVGTDALNLGNDRSTRNVDLQRMGRQPDSWDDDTETERACRRHGLRFFGRPPMALSTEALMRDYYASAKFVLASSNLACACIVYSSYESLHDEPLDRLTGLRGGCRRRSAGW